MKAITILATFLITILGCNCQKAVTQSEAKATQTNKEMENTQNEMVYEYEAMTRGFYTKTTITGNQASITTSRDKTPVVVSLSASDMEKLNKLAQATNLENMANLKAPSEKRFYDGATTATFTITNKSSSYRSTEFDGGNPPAEIKEIVDFVVAIREK